MEKYIAAVDIGASSGRVMLGHYDGHEIHIEELHRFTHELINANGILFWDILYIWNEVKKGILKAYNRHGTLDTIGIDAFAPDFCFVSENGELLGQAKSYRNFTDGEARRNVVQRAGEDRLLEITGNAAIDIATLPQLWAYKNSCKDAWGPGTRMLPVPNLLNYFLGGKPCTDFTQASVSMLYDWKKKQWSRELLDTFGINDRLLPDVEQSPEPIGTCTLPGLEKTLIINIGSHDTAVANYLLSELDETAICLNTGTWTSVGIRSDFPLKAREAKETGLSSFGLPDGSFILCKNIIGTWFLQELKHCWENKGVCYSFQEMGEFAKEAEPVHTVLDLLQPRYLDAFGSLPDVMREDIKKQTGERPSDGQVIRMVYDFIIDTYVRGIDEIEKLTGKTYPSLVIGGGAVRDSFLCEYIGARCNKKVRKAPAESATLGNIMLQLEATGDIRTKEKKKEMIHLFVQRGD